MTKRLLSCSAIATAAATTAAAAAAAAADHNNYDLANKAPP